MQEALSDIPICSPREANTESVEKTGESFMVLPRRLGATENCVELKEVALEVEVVKFSMPGSLEGLNGRKP